MTKMTELRPKPRLQEPNRSQLRLVPLDLDRAVPEDHSVRAVWEFVVQLDFSELHEAIKAVEGRPGRSPIDPRILTALWLQATLDGIGSARELSRLCREHLIYQWICGEVSVNYHTLADFRTDAEPTLDKLLTHSVTVLLEQGLADLKRVSQDGLHVRASAGANSFRRRKRLEEFHKAAQEQVQRLRQEIDGDPAATRRRQDAARLRTAEDRAKRLRRALEQLPEVEKRKKSRNGKKKTEARVSTTDPEARVMKMADGGFRPAFNVHLGTDTGSQAIVAVEVNNDGNEAAMMVPLTHQVRSRFDRVPQQWLADGGCMSLENIETLTAEPFGCTIYGPIRAPRRTDRKPTEVLPTDTPAVASWRRRMETEEAKQIYKQRAATSECVNAQFRNRGLQQFLVRSLKKVRAVALWYALAHNMTRIWALA